MDIVEALSNAGVDVTDLAALASELTEQYPAGHQVWALGQMLDAIAEDLRPAGIGDTVTMGGSSVGPWSVLAVVRGWAMVALLETGTDEHVCAVRVERLRRVKP